MIDDDRGDGVKAEPSPSKWPFSASAVPQPSIRLGPGSFEAGMDVDLARSVVLTGLRIPFWSLVGFLVKLSLAAIPAAIILAIVYALIGGFIISGISAMFYHPN